MFNQYELSAIIKVCQELSRSGCELEVARLVVIISEKASQMLQQQTGPQTGASGLQTISSPPQKG